MSAVEEHLIDAGAERGTVRLRGLGWELRRRGLPYPELARRAGLVRKTVENAATGRRRTQIRVAREMANALGLPLWDLCAPPPEPRGPAEHERRGAA